MIRNATVLLLAAALALNATAANLEIPQKYLEQEARTRAAFTPAERARVSALEARLSPKTSVQDATAMTLGETKDIIAVIMMDIWKSALKEAREAATISRKAAEQSLAAKDSKLAQENAKISAQQREAEERFKHAMDAATTAMATGMVAGSPQIVGGVGVSVPTRTPTKTPAPGK